MNDSEKARLNELMDKKSPMTPESTALLSKMTDSVLAMFIADGTAPAGGSSSFKKRGRRTRK